MSDAAPLALRTKAAYSIGSTGEASLTIVFNTFNFLFYNNVLGVSGTLCGLAVAIAMVVDAITDPLVGSLSDRWHSRWGRRHPFLYGSAIPAALFFVCIYAPPSSLDEVGLFAWFTLFTVLLRTAMTFYYVPHLALGAEMATGYAERSVLMSYNTIFGLVGTSGISFLAWTYLGDDTAIRESYRALAGGIAAFAAALFLASAWFTRDQVPRLSEAPADLPGFDAAQMFAEVRQSLENRNYRTLLIGLIFLSATLGLHETLGAHLSLFFWELEAEQIRYLSLGAPPGLILAALLTPKLHVWFDKRETLIAGVLGMTFASSGPIVLRLLGWFPETGDAALFPALFLLKGCSYGASAIMVISILSTLADVTDEHELVTGRRQEGIFFAARSFFSKLTSGLGHLLAGVAIDWIAFPVGAKAGEVAASVVFDFGIVAGPLTSVPAWISLFFYARYRIDKARHAEIRQALERREPLEPLASEA